MLFISIERSETTFRRPRRCYAEAMHCLLYLTGARVADVQTGHSLAGVSSELLAVVEANKDIRTVVAGGQNSSRPQIASFLGVAERITARRSRGNVTRRVLLDALQDEVIPFYDDRDLD